MVHTIDKLQINFSTSDFSITLCSQLNFLSYIPRNHNIRSAANYLSEKGP